MPALSKAQFRFMEEVANGSIKPSSLSPEKAAALRGEEGKLRLESERFVKSVPAAPPVASPVGGRGRAPEAGRGPVGVPPAAGEHGPGAGGPVPLAAGAGATPQVPGAAGTERQGVAVPATSAEEVAPLDLDLSSQSESQSEQSRTCFNSPQQLLLATSDLLNLPKVSEATG
jgi:hypothetical protein